MVEGRERFARIPEVLAGKREDCRSIVVEPAVTLEMVQSSPGVAGTGSGSVLFGSRDCAREEI